jgi:glycerophosphoryl diester phosphodiesterase
MGDKINYSKKRTHTYTDEHELFPGRASRKICKQYGLQVYLEHDYHINIIHGKGRHKELAKEVLKDNYNKTKYLIKIKSPKTWSDEDREFIKSLKGKN